MTRASLPELIKRSSGRSAWQRGVQEYALEMVEALSNEAFDASLTEEKLLKGAKNWQEYSTSGRSLTDLKAIAKRLCNASQLKYTRNGELPMSKKYSWLDMQAVALQSAAERILTMVDAITKADEAVMSTSFFYGGIRHV